jgi:hypothetical protein
MDEAPHGSLRTNLKQAPWPKIVGRALAGGLAFILASRAFGTDPSEATTGGISGFFALLAVQAWLVLRHGPDAAGDEVQEEKSPEDKYEPPLFGNG